MLFVLKSCGKHETLAFSLGQTIVHYNVITVRRFQRSVKHLCARRKTQLHLHVRVRGISRIYTHYVK